MADAKTDRPPLISPGLTPRSHKKSSSQITPASSHGIQICGGNRSDEQDLRGWLFAFGGGAGVTAGLSNISGALKFRLQLFNLAPGPTG